MQSGHASDCRFDANEPASESASASPGKPTPANSRVRRAPDRGHGPTSQERVHADRGGRVRVLPASSGRVLMVANRGRKLGGLACVTGTAELP